MLSCDASGPVKVVAPPLLHRVSHCQATCPIVTGGICRGEQAGAFYTFAHLPGGVGQKLTDSQRRKHHWVTHPPPRQELAPKLGLWVMSLVLILCKNLGNLSEQSKTAAAIDWSLKYSRTTPSNPPENMESRWCRTCLNVSPFTSSISPGPSCALS